MDPRSIHRNNEISIANNSTTLECVDTFKYLGLTVDKNLSFAEHTEVIKRKVDQQTGLLWKVISFISKDRVNGLTARLLNCCGDAIILPLVHIFNSSIKKSVFPAIWKVARVTPLI